MKRSVKWRRSRARQRGVTPVSTVLEAALVMGWFVALLLGEQAVSSATDARRSAESAAVESATKSSASECQPRSATVRGARTNPLVIASGVPKVQAAMALVQALGLGQQRTFPNYLKPLRNVLVQGSSSAEEIRGAVNPAGKTFEAQRELGCLEMPIDLPNGSMGEYRLRLWIQNLRGY